MPTTPQQFAPVARRTVTEEIRERLSASIASGDLAPGERLPSERSLCESFRVARTSVREAIRGLVSQGLIERRANRVYVADPAAANTDRRKARVHELFEVRRVMELPIVELAAERATAAERAEIDRVAARFDSGMALDAFRRLDREFHAALSRASHNPLMADLYIKVLDALFESAEFASLLGDDVNSGAVAQIIEESAGAHRRIAAAILLGDPVNVVVAAERHLGEVEDRMVAQLA